MSTKRLTGAATLALVLLCGAWTPANAQQTLNFTLGGFRPLGLEGRDTSDVLVANDGFLVFDGSDFNGATFGGEWLVGAGRFVEFGAGVSFYQRTVPTVYRDFVDSSGFEIEQELRLRQVPLSFTARIVPTSLSSP